MFRLYFIHTLAHNEYQNKKIVNFRMPKGILMGSSFVEKYFLCIKVFRSKLKFTFVYYSNFSLGIMLSG